MEQKDLVEGVGVHLIRVGQPGPDQHMPLRGHARVLSLGELRGNGQTSGQHEYRRENNGETVA